MNIVLIVNLVPPSEHYMKANIEESESFKTDDFVLSICFEILQEIFGHLSPVKTWFNMMSNMISIIERILIIEMIHTLNCQSTIVFNTLQILLHCSNLRVDKYMLREIAKHHYESNHHEWYEPCPYAEDWAVLPWEINGRIPAGTS